MSDASPESRVLEAGYARNLGLWMGRGGRVVTLDQAIAEIDAGQAPGPATITVPASASSALSDEQVDEILNGGQRAQQAQADQWAEHLADLVAAKVVAKLKPTIRAELRKARDA